MRQRVPFSVHDLTGALWSLVSTTAGLSLAIWIVPGVRITSWWSVFLAAFVVGVGDVVLRPLWRVVAGALGSSGPWSRGSPDRCSWRGSPSRTCRASRPTTGAASSWC
ncbi:phage holin family protein [Oerskovia sp. M15]